MVPPHFAVVWHDDLPGPITRANRQGLLQFFPR
ncbi:MAG: hypothetical protein AVDCRST_MAG93-8020, partial [uncultured Chloroflexia bacterium]